MQLDRGGAWLQKDRERAGPQFRGGAWGGRGIGAGPESRGTGAGPGEETAGPEVWQSRRRGWGGGAGAGCEAGISQPRMGDGDPGGKWPESEPLEGRLRE